VAEALAKHGASFLRELVHATGRLTSEVEDGLWELAAAGMVTADGFENLRALVDPKRRRGEGRARAHRPRHAEGRWALLNPALLMIIMTLVFGTIMRARIDHYSIFLLSMLLPWTFFSQSLAYAVESVVGNAQLMKKIRIPKIVFPMAAVLANVINFGLSLIPLALLVLVLRFPLHWTWVYLPVPMVGLLLFTMGAAFLFSAVNVFFRDVSHIVQILLSAWFYFTPIIYSLDFIPIKHRWIFRLNPLLYVMNGFRLSIYYGLLPTAQSVVMSLAVGLLALLVGYAVFRRYSDAFVFYV